MPDALLQRGLTLFILIAFFFLAVGLGRLLTSRIGVSFNSRAEMIFFCSGVGLGLIGYGVFLLGLFNGYRPLPLNIMILVLLALSLAGWFLTKPPVMAYTRLVQQAPWDRVALIALVSILTVALILALTPEIGKDALIYHLAVPKLFLKHHGLTFIPGNIFSNYPLHSEMLFLVGLYIQSDILAKGMHFLALLLVLLGMVQFMRHRTPEHGYPALTLLIFCMIPSVFMVSHTAYNDLFVTLYALAAVFALMNWLDCPEGGWLMLCGVFTGLALASKYTALFLPFMGCLGILWAAHRNRLPQGKAFRSLLIYGFMVAFVGCPFYIKNWLVTGNPFYPFLYGLFGGMGWDPQQAQFYDYFVQGLGMGRTLPDYLLLPWNLSFHAKVDSPQFDGVIGPLFIALLPFAAGIRKAPLSMKIMGAYCILFFLFWASAAQQIRYLIPALPFLAMICGFILTSYRKKKAIFYLLCLLIAGSLALNGYHIIGHFTKIDPLNVVIGRESRTDFLSRTLPSYGMFDAVNHHLPPDAKIFLIYMKNWTFLCERECYSDSMFESYTIQKIMSQATNPAAVASALVQQGFTHLLFDLRYTDGPLSTFTPTEKTLFQAFTDGYLELVKKDRSYYLYRIRPPQP